MNIKKGTDGFVDFRERVTPWMRVLRVKVFQFNFVPENFFESMKKYGYTTQNTVWLDMYSNRIFVSPRFSSHPDKV